MSAFFQDDKYSKLIKRPKLTETCCDENLPCCDEQTGLKIYTILTECGGSLATHAIEGNFQAGRNVYHTASTDCFYCSGITTNITGYTEFPIADVVLDGCTCRVTPPPPPLTVTLLTPCGGTSETHYVIGSYLGLYVEDTSTNICYYGTNLANTNMTLVGTEITAFTQGTCSCSTPPPPGPITCEIYYVLQVSKFDINTGQQLTLQSISLYPGNLYNQQNPFGTKIFDIGAFFISQGFVLQPNEIFYIFDNIVPTINNLTITSKNVNVNTSTGTYSNPFPTPFFINNGFVYGTFNLRFTTIPAYGTGVFDYTINTDCQNLNIKLLF